MLQEHYGSLFEKSLLDEIIEVGVEKSIPAGTPIIKIGDYIKSMPLVLQGVIKISREDENGEELFLYFLEKGNTCAMTLSCCMGNQKSEIKATAETDTVLLMIPIQKMEVWTSTYKTWRNFVFESYHTRLMEILQAIDNIAFSKLDERLIKYLKDKQKIGNTTILEVTHREIANDLHSSRVVISRLLKKLENQQKITIQRNAIKILAL